VIDRDRRIFCATHLLRFLSRCYSLHLPSFGVRDQNKGMRVNEFSGVVTDIREESRIAGRQRWQMALDRTEFVAGDVGVLEAIARSGARLVVPVLGVVVDGGEVWHVVEKPLAAGTTVTGRVDEFAE
jgi:Ser-tRNA(Ala) deacylase AlaX